jgi:hypothetical protein
MDTIYQLRKDFMNTFNQIQSQPKPSPIIQHHPIVRLEKSRFISPEIQNYIQTKALMSWCVELVDCTITLYVYNDTTDPVSILSDYIDCIHTIIRICIQYSTVSCPNVHLIVYLTPYKKELTSNMVLGPHEVNSGFTAQCKYNHPVVVFRREEWVKVCIHELIHYFGIDFSDMNTKTYVPNLQKIFYINSNHLLYEAYTEFWAEIMFCCLVSLTIHTSIDTIIRHERIHSTKQCKKILRHMKVRYTDLLYQTADRTIPPMFRENTNVFGYYFIKTIFFWYIEEFLSWCKQHNETILSITKSPTVIHQLCDWISQKSNSPIILREMQYKDTEIDKKNKSLKMMYYS